MRESTTKNRARPKRWQSWLGVRMVPWCLCLLATGALVAREVMHFKAGQKTERLDSLLQAVYRARGEGDERQALLGLAAWLASEGIATGVSPYDTQTGERMSVSDIERTRQPSNMGFELVFDFDWDSEIERRCPVYLKDPANILLLMRE